MVGDTVTDLSATGLAPHTYKTIKKDVKYESKSSDFLVERFIFFTKVFCLRLSIYSFLVRFDTGTVVRVNANIPAGLVSLTDVITVETVTTRLTDLSAVYWIRRRLTGSAVSSLVFYSTNKCVLLSFSIH